MSTGSKDLAAVAFLEPHRAVVVMGVLMTSATLGLPTLGAESLWFDEAWTIDLAGRPIGEQLREYVATNAEGGPVYHILVHYWMQLFGNSEFAVRAISAIAQIGAVGLSFGLVRRLVDERVAVISALLIATSPALVYFSQEARNYSLSVFLFLLSLWLFVRYLESSRKGFLAALCQSFILLSLPACE